MQRNFVRGCRKRSFHCAFKLFQAGDRDEDCDLPTKRFKILQTTVSISRNLDTNLKSKIYLKVELHSYVRS